MQALPYATQLLAHLGADVVKVEAPGRGDTGRSSNPFVEDEQGRKVGATFLRNNLSKKSVAIDLKSERGQALFKQLVPRFDVVAENFRAGSMESLGLGYEALAAIHPPLVYVSLSGFGNLVPSPYAHWPAYAPIAEAMGGLYEPSRKEGSRRRSSSRARSATTPLRSSRRSARSRHCATATARVSGSTWTSRCTTA